MVEGNYKYTYNNGHLAMADPLAAARNFLNALERIPSIIDQYKGCLLYTSIRKEQKLDEYKEHKFSDDDRKNLRETGNLGRVVDLVDSCLLYTSRCV